MFKQLIQYQYSVLREINTEIIIAASPESTWKVLTDFNSFSHWNPFIRQIDGDPKVGTKLKIYLHTLSGKNRIYHPTVTKVEPNLELRWFGRSIIPGMFNGERIFTIESLKNNNTRFIHREIFTGLLVSLIGARLDKDMYQNFRRMNESLKERVEQLAI